MVSTRASKLERKSTIVEPLVIAPGKLKLESDQVSETSEEDNQSEGSSLQGDKEEGKDSCFDSCTEFESSF